jgi:hypothetical protein
MIRMEIGDFAYFEFTLSSKKKKEEPAPMKGHYRIADMDKNNLLLTEDDENDLQVIVPKARITIFKPVKLNC